MKKIISYLCLSLMLGFSVELINAQQKKFKFTHVSRDVKKEAKKYEKQGFTAFPGMPPLSLQLNEAFNKQADVDEEGFPKYLIANGSSVAQTQAAAEMQATELAKQRLVGLVESQMKSVVESNVSNNQMDAKDAASLTKTIEVTSNKVSKKLGRVIILFKVLRAVDKNTEVQMLVGYNYAMAKKAMLEEMKAELQSESEDIRAKYDKFLNPDALKTGEIKNIAE